MSEIPMYPNEASDELAELRAECTQLRQDLEASQQALQSAIAGYTSEFNTHHDTMHERDCYRRALEDIAEDANELEPYVSQPARSGALLGIKAVAANALAAYPPCGGGCLCRHCSKPRSEHGKHRRCPNDEGTSYWPVGEPGGG